MCTLPIILMEALRQMIIISEVRWDFNKKNRRVSLEKNATFSLEDNMYYWCTDFSTQTNSIKNLKKKKKGTVETISTHWEFQVDIF